jgi:hypothetical protein
MEGIRKQADERLETARSEWNSELAARLALGYECVCMFVCVYHSLHKLEGVGFRTCMHVCIPMTTLLFCSFITCVSTMIHPHMYIETYKQPLAHNAENLDEIKQRYYKRIDELRRHIEALKIKRERLESGIGSGAHMDLSNYLRLRQRIGMSTSMCVCAHYGCVVVSVFACVYIFSGIV